MSVSNLHIIDLEITHKKKIESIGLIDNQGNVLYHGEDLGRLSDYLLDCDVLIGHNILDHDLPFLLKAKEIPIAMHKKPIIDTLWLSSLIFIQHPYHRLIKDYKIDKTNDPIQDAKLCLEVFQNCVEKFLNFDSKLQNWIYRLLYQTPQFRTFFSYLQEQNLFSPTKIDLKSEIRLQFSSLFRSEFFDQLLPKFLSESPVELAYVLRLLQIKMQVDRDISILPARIVHNLPKVHDILQSLLTYKIYDAKRELKRFFGYDDFRSFETAEGKSVSQQEVIESALRGEDLLAIFSTGGGKSLTFQLPALMIAEQMPYLTLVISPLQSLMKDQVDVLNHRFNITNAGYLNATLSPLEKKEICEKVQFGGIDLLYLSPEMLRSQSTIKLLEKRLISRIVIDEAHCFSKWGHDFRIDYMFIADFVKALSKKNKSLTSVKISCFTATGKQEVTQEIKDYFKTKLGSELREFRSTSSRSNLSYKVISTQSEDERFDQLLELLNTKVGDQPCIIFTKYTGEGSENEQGAQNLAQKINESLGGDYAHHYHGKMKSEEKRAIQDDFIAGRINIIVATNAFGMGVDKNNVRFVIHYGIPSSVENYIQEAGRAGRDGELAECIILYHPEDTTDNLQLNKSGEVSEKEIKSLLSSLKNRFTKLKSSEKLLVKSAKELVADAGWLEANGFNEKYAKTKTIYETKVKTALYFLEKGGFIKRAFNRTKVWATANTKRTLNEQFARIDQIFSPLLTAKELEKIKEIYKAIKDSKVISIEDINVGLPLRDRKDESVTLFGEGTWKKGVESLVSLLRSEHFIEQDDEITMIINPERKTSLKKLAEIDQIGTALLSIIATGISQGQEAYFNKNQINSQLSKSFEKVSLSQELDLLLYHFQKNKEIRIKGTTMLFLSDGDQIRATFSRLIEDTNQFLNFLLASDYSQNQKSAHNLAFTQNLNALVGDFSRYLQRNYSLLDLEKLLKFLHRFGIIGLEGGLFLYHTKFQILAGDNIADRFTKAHYEDLQTFYQKKTEQAHIMDELAQMISKGYAAERFMEDYFSLDADTFRKKYFKGREKELSRPLSKKKYNELYGSLSAEQCEVLHQKKDNLLIIAGPGAGKTKTLVHKVASLILEDNIKKEEFLLLTFSRSAKFELKNRIINLIGNQGYFLEINTFHGYAFKLLQKDPSSENLSEESGDIIKQAISYLEENPHLQLPYSVLVVDEFQDLDDEQFRFIALVKERSSKGEEMKAIAAGDDDQSIFGFRGGNIKYIQQFKNIFNAKELILTDNYRSTQDLIDYTSTFISLNPQRIKQNTKLISKVLSEDNSLFQTEKSKIQTINLGESQPFGFLSELLSKPFFQEKLKSDSSIAILFHNNETGLLIDTFLQRQGYKTQLLLKEDGYKLSQTVEFFHFLTSCCDEQNPVDLKNIDDKLEKVISIYGINKNTELLTKFVLSLKTQNTYLNPEILKDAILEVSESDFCDHKGKIMLSTFHRAKGLEFDIVIIVLDQEVKRSQKRTASLGEKEEMIRLLYVAMTRAKRHLFILGNQASNPFFQELVKNSPDHYIPSIAQQKVREIGILTSCMDINLGYTYYNGQKPTLADLELIGTKVQCSFNQEEILIFSKDAFVLQPASKYFSAKIKKQIENGYRIKEAVIHQRLAYYLSKEQKRTLVYLFYLILEKNE